MKNINRVLILVLSCMMLTGCISNPYKDGIKNLEDGKYAEAAENFYQAIEEENNIADSYRGLGIALWETKDYQGAYDAMESALEQGTKENATIYSVLGNSAMQIKDYAKAAEYYEAALSMKDISDELEKETKYNLIAAYEYAGDVNKAKEKLEEYISDYPEDEDAIREADFLETR